MDIRKDLYQDVFGLMTCLLPMDDRIVAGLANAVPERGEALWLRFRSWQNAGNTDKTFVQFTGAMIVEKMLQTQHSPATPRPVINREADTSPNPQLVQNIRAMLQNANDRQAVKEQIKAEVKRRLNPRPASCSVTVSWSSVPNHRSVYIHPNGFQAFSVTCN